jgi:hypothetical protein
VTLVARTNLFVRESKNQGWHYHGQAKLVRATSPGDWAAPGGLGTKEKVPALPIRPIQTLLKVSKLLPIVYAFEKMGVQCMIPSLERGQGTLRIPLRKASR